MTNRVCTADAPAAIGPYSQGVTIEKLVFTSGQLPCDPQTGAVVGKTAEAQAEQSFKNIAAVLKAAGSSMKDVIKTTVFVQSMGDFAAINEVYAKHFNGEILPARSCVEVAKLPKGVLIETEAIAVRM